MNQANVSQYWEQSVSVGLPQIALTKTVPPSTNRVRVERGRLLKALGNSAARRLILIKAPASRPVAQPVPVKAQTPPSGAQNVQSIGGGVDSVPMAHCFGVPGAGSPNPALVHAVPLVNVLTTNEPFAP